MPAGWTKLDKDENARLRRLTGAQSTEANALAAEIQASTTYLQDFGPHAPPQATVTAALLGTGALTLEGPRALAWSPYVGDMKLIQGDSTSTVMDQLAAVMGPAAAANPELGQTYPLLIQFVTTRSKNATKAAEAKKADQKKALKEGASSSAPATASAAASSNATAAPVAVVGAASKPAAS